MRDKDDPGDSAAAPPEADARFAESVTPSAEADAPRASHSAPPYPTLPSFPAARQASAAASGLSLAKLTALVGAATEEAEEEATADRAPAELPVRFERRRESAQPRSMATAPPAPRHELLANRLREAPRVAPPLSHTAPPEPSGAVAPVLGSTAVPVALFAACENNEKNNGLNSQPGCAALQHQKKGRGRGPISSFPHTPGCSFRDEPMIRAQQAPLRATMRR